MKAGKEGWESRDRAHLRPKETPIRESYRRGRTDHATWQILRRCESILLIYACGNNNNNGNNNGNSNGGSGGGGGGVATRPCIALRARALLQELSVAPSLLLSTSSDAASPAYLRRKDGASSSSSLLLWLLGNEGRINVPRSAAAVDGYHRTEEN
jgi:hypothetical protein